MRQRDGDGHEEEVEEPDGTNTGWGWGWWILIAVGFFYLRSGSHNYRGSGGEGGLAPYRTFESENYEPGSVGAFWANEERAARGVPGAVASPGLVYTPPPANSGLGQIQAEQASMAEQAAQVHQQARMMKLLEQQQVEIEKMRNEIERLRNTKRATEY